MLHSRCLVFVIAALLSAACSGASAVPTSPASAVATTSLTSQVSGSWALTSLRPAGQPEQPTPAGASYGLTFADGRAAVRADCNVCNGPVTASDQTIVIGPVLACTRAACSTMAFETLYESILAGESQAAVSGNVLTLSSPRGGLIFRR